MYECEFCGAQLDPGEKCSCRETGLALHCIQAPVISEDLEGVRRRLDLVLNEIRQLPADDNSLKRVRSIRAELSKKIAVLEAQRKEVKRQVLQPYTQAEEKYKVCIADPYRAADAELKAWVDEYQGEMKLHCEKVLYRYFDELCEANGIKFLRFSQTGVTVDMAMARQKEPRKAMDAIEAFVLRVRGDMDTILTLDDAAEVLVEYQKTLDLSGAIRTVKDRKNFTAYMQQQVMEVKEQRQQDKRHRDDLMAVMAAMADTAALIPQEETYTMTFTVTGTMQDLKALKAYILAANLIIEEDENEQ